MNYHREKKCKKNSSVNMGKFDINVGYEKINVHKEGYILVYLPSFL